MEKLEQTKWMTQSLVIMFSCKFFYFEQDNQRKEYNELNMLEKKCTNNDGEWENEAEKRRNEILKSKKAWKHRPTATKQKLQPVQWRKRNEDTINYAG